MISKNKRAQACAIAVLLSVLMPQTSAELRVIAVALFKDKAILNIDGQQRMVRLGETTPEGVSLLAADASHARIAIAGKVSDLKIDGRISSTYAAAPAATVVRLVPGPNGHYFVDGQINGNSVRFLVDTGATAVAINKVTARRIGLQYRVDGTRGSVETASGSAIAYGVIFDEVKIQSLRLAQVKGLVIDGASPGDALLGQSFLNRLDIHREGAVLELRGR